VEQLPEMLYEIVVIIKLVAKAVHRLDLDQPSVALLSLTPFPDQILLQTLLNSIDMLPKLSLKRFQFFIANNLLDFLIQILNIPEHQLSVSSKLIQAIDR
jgi:hypothetical protein